MSSPQPRRCDRCAHFGDRPQWLEATFPGLASLSSAYAAVRDADGVCAVHERYVSARSHCQCFAGRSQAG